MKRHLLVLAASGAAWSIVVALGSLALLMYEDAPGHAGAAPARWPDGSQVPRAADRPTLVMFAHPRCPCTRASVGELALLMARSQGLVSAWVLFSKPKDFPPGWEATDILASAAAIPDVHAECDEGGAEAARFHATISGQTLLYAVDGRLLFDGGITASRGHSGDNAGRTAIVSLLTQGRADRTRTFAFGCSLLDPQRPCHEGVDRCISEQ